ncbi:MAG TPA: hypothetical protein VJT73_02000 [Polyangiaceae bacterium]|nr:hypothetical protein [Polyangiaceae bacterium]
MTHAANFRIGEIALAAIVALAAQLGGLLLLKSGGGSVLYADISDDHAKPISVAITPIIDDAPLLKLGEKRQPGKLPDRWIAPRPVLRQQAAAFPSPHAAPVPRAIPTTKVPDAGTAPPRADLEIARQAEPVLTAQANTPPQVSTVLGATDGVKEGTETDPLKANAVNMYRSQLTSWFLAKFAIRGKIPFETLKNLRATAVANIGADRTVTGFSITKPSGDATFDEQVKATLSSIVSSGAELPSPPPMYPDILQSSLPIGFRCTNRSSCE